MYFLVEGGGQSGGTKGKSKARPKNLPLARGQGQQGGGGAIGGGTQQGELQANVEGRRTLSQMWPQVKPPRAARHGNGGRPEAAQQGPRRPARPKCKDGGAQPTGGGWIGPAVPSRWHRGGGTNGLRGMEEWCQRAEKLQEKNFKKNAQRVGWDKGEGTWGVSQINSPKSPQISCLSLKILGGERNNPATKRAL